MLVDFYFAQKTSFPKNLLPNLGCGLSMDAAYTEVNTVLYTTLKLIKLYNNTSLFTRRFEAYQSVFCKCSNVSSSLDSFKLVPELASLS